MEAAAGNVRVLTDSVQNLGHLVEFLGANIGAVCESKVNQHVATLEVLVRSTDAIMINQGERPSDLGLSVGRVRLGKACFLHY